MMDDVVSTNIIRIMHKNREVFFRTTMIDGTIESQCTYIVNSLVAQTNLNIHYNPMNAIIVISHVIPHLFHLLQKQVVHRNHRLHDV